ncbi:MAG: hypothetical protein C0603_00050 [Denitrovibrio sp.]|nr:MAG: hypothetical protein C0603_00050 [Denitrovibrio sp.]
MNNFFNLISESESMHYVVLNPEDNTVSYVSDSFKKTLQDKSYKNKQLRTIIGCPKLSNCPNSAVELQLPKINNKIVQLVECDFFHKKFLVVKFEVKLQNEKKHVMIFTDTEDTSLGSELVNDLDTIVTHEIKNALNNLSLINQNLRIEMDSKELDTEEMLKLSDNNIHAIEMILALFSEIKASFSHGKQATSDTIKVSHIIDEAVQNNIMLINNKNLVVNINDNTDSLLRHTPNINYSRELLHLLFSNLVNNASKYATESTQIDISLHKDLDVLNVTIINHGQVDQAVASDFFSKYTKSKDSQGMGFGTYCCKLITDLFKGQISMDQDGEKVSITVELPC